jgi:phosphoribosylglycinamide formyltransferase-1
LIARVKIGVLASHEGTTLQAVLDACRARAIDVTVAVVISNNGSSGALRRAGAMDVPALHLSSVTHPDSAGLDRAITDALLDRGVELVLLAGYMKKLGPLMLQTFRGRIINTHPALLPKHGGRGMFGHHVHAAVLAAGDTVTGVTIHHVEDEYDTGPAIAQARVPVEVGDTAESLAARVQARERELLVQTLGEIASGAIALSRRSS